MTVPKNPSVAGIAPYVVLIDVERFDGRRAEGGNASAPAAQPAYTVFERTHDRW